MCLTDPKSHVTICRLKEGPQRIINDTDNDAEILQVHDFWVGHTEMGWNKDFDHTFRLDLETMKKVCQTQSNLIKNDWKTKTEQF